MSLSQPSQEGKANADWDSVAEKLKKRTHGEEAPRALSIGMKRKRKGKKERKKDLKTLYDCWLCQLDDKYTTFSAHVRVYQLPLSARSSSSSSSVL